MATEYTFNVGMLFRKMFCARCGTQLQRKRVKKTYKRGEPGFRNSTELGHFINFSTYSSVYYIYHCPDCGNELTYDRQLSISRMQKKENRIILESSNEDANTDL